MKVKHISSAARLAKLLKAWRERTKKSQEEAAKAIGVNWHTIQRWESSLFMPSASKLAMICKATGIDLLEIFNGRA